MSELENIIKEISKKGELNETALSYYVLKIIEAQMCHLDELAFALYC